MSYISKIDLSTAPQEVRAAVDNHLARGYQLTNEKLTLLHNVTAFHTLEESSYELDRELQRLIGKRAADFYEYAISLQNDCLVCSAYFPACWKRTILTLPPLILPMMSAC